MSDVVFPLHAWGEEMTSLAAVFVDGFEGFYGYAAYGYTVSILKAEDGARAVACLAEAGDTGALLDYYTALGEVQLMDLHNGTWIVGAQEVARGILAGCLMRVTGAVDDTVTVFATNRGGGMYAVSAVEVEVARLACPGVSTSPVAAWRRPLAAAAMARCTVRR
ncbi:hypothetical protein OG897_30070 [Streptomyces sp. NBC_00237]|uniref:hypothetical protein n=1 Tax=Streptomyces sp. NBC_00237 TaxID=2975687 RepID=UPI002258F642|nr:hypothetical protein [Streptomyces sp. NBC_00237]MCX5205688.1 hypothetical protein [Streptomyces sp. NBC_00237]